VAFYAQKVSKKAPFCLKTGIICFLCFIFKPYKKKEFVEQSM